MYSEHNEEKSVIAERFATTLKNKIYKCMASVSKNVYIDKLDDIVTKYNNTYHGTIKMKPIDVKLKTYIDSSKETNDKDPKFKIKNIKLFLQKVTLQIGLNKFFSLKQLKILCHGHMLLMILMEKKLLERFTKTNCKKKIIVELDLSNYATKQI